MYWRVTKFTPWTSAWLPSVAENVDEVPEPAVSPTDPISFPDETKMMLPVGAAWPDWPVTVPVMVSAELGEMPPVAVAAVVDGNPPEETT